MPLKKLKTKSPFKIILLMSIIIIVLFFKNSKSIYIGNENYIEGIIYECDYKNDQTNLKIKAKENVLIKYYGKFPCKLGLNIKAHGKFTKPSENSNFYLFNYKKYLLSLKIHYIFKANNIEIKNNKISAIYKIKNSINSYINKYKAKAYLKTFILGKTDDIEKNIKESYQTNGISHLLAISGAQISALTSILSLILNKFLKKNSSNIIIYMFLIFYLFITDFSPSILRATVFFIFLSLNKMFELKMKSLDILLIVFLMLLIINPYYIYNLGFILSFTVSFYLILFKKIIKNSKDYIEKTLNISLIAFLSSTPIIINTFFKLNIITPLVNLYFVPFMTITYFIGLLTIIFKPLDIYFYNLTLILEKTSLIVSNIKIFNLSMHHINFIFIILYYVLITIILYLYQKSKKAMLLFLVILIIHHNVNSIISSSYITALDVSQGDSILLKLEKSAMLIDTGGLAKSSFNITKNITIPYLNSNGINKITYLIITHGDADHMGEAINLVENFKVEKVIFNCGEYQTLEKELIKELDKKKIKHYSCIKELNIDNNKLYFLQTKEYDNENDNSNVIYMELNGYKFMFMADAGVEKEEDIIDKYNISDIDVLKVGHHGSKTSSSKEFINEINPNYSIISVGKNNRYGHPNKEVLENLKDSKIYRTDKDGSIMFKIKNNKLKVETCSS